MKNRKNRILGSMLGAAIGDAMGAVTEVRPAYLIKEKWGLVTDLINPPYDTYAKNQPAGQVTDDFSVSYLLAKEIVENKGIVDSNVARQALIKWSKMPRYYHPFVGPTSEKSILRLKGEMVDKPTDGMASANNTATNGAGMKIAPVGLINAGNLDRAIDEAIVVGAVSHQNVIALTAASAVACAIAKAVCEGCLLEDIIEAGLYGATEGHKRTKKLGYPSAGPSIKKRIELAVNIGLRYSNDFEKAMFEIGDVVGTGLMAAESIPAVFGMITACGGDATKSIIMAVNAGDDTDTVATMVGAITGAFCGDTVFETRHKELIEKMNAMDFERLASELDALIDAR